jgi:hypothetical protein
MAVCSSRAIGISLQSTAESGLSRCSWRQLVWSAVLQRPQASSRERRPGGCERNGLFAAQPVESRRRKKQALRSAWRPASPRNAHAAPHSSGEHAHSILTCGSTPSAVTRRAYDARRVSAVSPPPRETGPSGSVSRDRFTSFHRPADRSAGTQLRQVLAQWRGSNPSALSSSPRIPVTSRNGERVPTAQQGTSPDFRPLLFRPHSQSAAFESPGRPEPGTGCLTGSRRPSCVSRHRLWTGHVAIGVTRGLAAVCPRLPPGHSFLEQFAQDFWGPNVEAPPYPPVASVRGRARLLSKSLASPHGPFMVELFIAAAFFRSRRAGQARSVPSPGSELPTPDGLNEVEDPEPPVRDYAADAASPASMTAALW